MSSSTFSSSGQRIILHSLRRCNNRNYIPDLSTTLRLRQPTLVNNSLRPISVTAALPCRVESPTGRRGRQNRTVHTATQPDSTASSSTSVFSDQIPTNGPEVPSIESVLLDLDRASQFNQGKGGAPNGPNTGWSKRQWDHAFVRQTVDRYEFYLTHFYNELHRRHQNGAYLDGGHSGHPPGPLSPSDSMLEVSDEMRRLFFSPETTQQAFLALQRCKIPTPVLSRKVRGWERYIGSMGLTEMNDSLSLSMLEANGKAGNVGRAIQLLSLRKSRGYKPTASEFIYAIKAIRAAGLYLRRNRNVFLSEQDQPQIDDPTRWLDAILLNMSQRGFSLSTAMANRMLHTYASTGKSGKMAHYFYRVVRHPINVDDNDNDNNDVDSDDGDNDDDEDKYPSRSDTGIARFWNRPVKIRIEMRPPPPYHKIPSQVKGKLVRKPGTEIKQLKLDRESDPDWSPVLTSAISFADSLKQGACGHDPIELDLISYSTLMMACINRGSLWRAMHLLDEVMPANGIEPDIVAYNILLMGLARVGDVPTMKDYFRQLLSNNLDPTKETIEAVVDGLLNLGDVGGAITFCQDSFNQHSVLPPYTSHLKILEFTLGRGLVYEAKRHVSFIQQLWKWEKNKYHSDDVVRMMELTQKNPKLSKEALQKMFAYFGEKLNDSDFY